MLENAPFGRVNGMKRSKVNLKVKVSVTKGPTVAVRRVLVSTLYS